MKAAALIIATILLLSAAAGCGTQKDYTDFAKCLTENGVTMYGASWCSHCQNVKDSFGEAFRFVNYIECDEATPGSQPEKCAAAKLQYFPTFTFKDGTSLFGEVSFDILSQKTGCEMP